MAIDVKGPFEEGDLIGGIEIEALIGTGGFGLVYRGKDQRGVTVAVKILRSEAENDADIAARLMKEANLLAEIDHPNIVGFHAAGMDGRLIYLAMEYVPGGTLRDRLPRGRPIDVEQALRWARHIAEGCAEVHKIRDALGEAVVHRDLKPENVLLSRDGVAKVTDFGIAKFRTSLKSTRSNERMGTPHYMPPEQMDGAASIDERVDVFALGVITYEMLAGMRPAEVGSNGELTMMEMVTRTLTQPVVPLPELNPDVPSHVWDIVRRMLAKERGQRFATMTEVAATLTGALKRFRKERGKKPSFAELPSAAEAAEAAPATTSGDAGATRYVPAGTGASSASQAALALASTGRAAQSGGPAGGALTTADTATLSATSHSSKDLARRRTVSPAMAVAGVVAGALAGGLVFARLLSGGGAGAASSGAPTTTIAPGDGSPRPPEQPKSAPSLSAARDLPPAPPPASAAVSAPASAAASPPPPVSAGKAGHAPTKAASPAGPGKQAAPAKATATAASAPPPAPTKLPGIAATPDF